MPQASILATLTEKDAEAVLRLAAVSVRHRRQNGPDVQEMQRCSESCVYFITHHTSLYDATTSQWLPFALWPAQQETLQTLTDERLVIILKARQLGFSWLVLAYALWLMLFRPAATVLLFSKRDDEAIELLNFRLKGMYDRLPDFLRLSIAPSTDQKHQWLMSNGSRAMAFPTTGGRSYTATLAIVDEADYVPDLGGLLNAVKPTVDAGGQMVLLSTPDKKQPQSVFKKIYRAATHSLNQYAPLFFSWSARPDRTLEWYEAQKSSTLSETGALENLHQEYPATDTEALAPNSMDKRLPQEWLYACYQERHTITNTEAPAIPALMVYAAPVIGQEYVVGADPAEGNPTSDDSSLHVLDKATGEECAVLAGKYEPAIFAGHIRTLCLWYNNAVVLPERNNHGHSVILWLEENAHTVKVLHGTDGRPGWLTTSTSKTKLYDDAATSFREGDALLHNQDTYLQLSGIEGSTLNAPKGEKDDMAMSYVLALMARSMGGAVAPMRVQAAPLIIANAGTPFAKRAGFR